MLQRVLDPALERQLADARQLLAELRDALVQFGAAAPDQAALASSIRQLDEFFLLVIVGEFNAGKSAFINALLGQTVLQEGVTPTTAQIHLVRYGDALARYTEEGLQVMAAPVRILRDVHIVDTPGTNAIHREHERLTSEFVPRSDLVLFVTSADRPFTETERAFLQAIRDWGKKIVIVLNKVDILERPGEVEEVVKFVRDAAYRLLGISPDIFPVSSRLAQRAKQENDGALLAASRFEALERFVRSTLDEKSRFRLKLANPLGVGQALASRYAGIADERLALLTDDLTLLEDIDRQLTVYREDLARGFDLRMSAVETVLVEMEGRGHRFFEDTLRIGRVIDLLNRARVQKEFEQRVVGDAPRQIEQRVSELIDWLIDQDFRQWQGVTARLADRQRQHASRMLGAPDVGNFHADRTRLIESVGREAQRVVDAYDKQREAEAIADQARVAVAAAAAAGGAAVGLGALVTIATTTAVADVTGLLMASVLAAVGLLVLPTRRRKAKSDLQEKIAALRRQLAEALRKEFAHAQERSASRIADAVAPYSRFVRAEEERWKRARAALTRLRDRTAALLAEPTGSG